MSTVLFPGYPEEMPHFRQLVLLSDWNRKAEIYFIYMHIVAYL